MNDCGAASTESSKLNAVIKLHSASVSDQADDSIYQSLCNALLHVSNGAGGLASRERNGRDRFASPGSTAMVPWNMVASRRNPGAIPIPSQNAEVGSGATFAGS